MKRILRYLTVALVGVFGGGAALVQAAAGNGTITVSVKRADLRPLASVVLQVAGVANRQGMTDANGAASIADLPLAGTVTLTPVRSGFRYDPPQATVDLANAGAISFVAIPTATDLAISIAADDAAPLVGGLVNGVITLRNLGVAAATDVTVGFSPLPGLVLEDAQIAQGKLEYQAYQTLWRVAQLDGGASAEMRVRLRATLPDANVLSVAVIEEMDQADVDPLNNSAEIIIHPKGATARLSLNMVIDPAPAKVGELVPVRLTVRNDGPNDATQVVVRSYLPPGASLTVPADGLSSSTLVIPRLAVGGEMTLSGAMRVRFAGTYPLIANVSSLEEQLPAGAPWPEARGQFTVGTAFSKVSLFAFSDPPNPRIGEEVTVQYVARNEGPDAVTGLQLFTREDARLGTPLTTVGNHAPPPLPGPFVFGEVLPAGSYTYVEFRYSVKAAGNLTNYFTVEYQDQLIPNADDHPELAVQIQTSPADVGLSLDAKPKETTVAPGEAVALEFPVHNDGPQPARGVIVDYDGQGLLPADLDEIVHVDRVVRPQAGGYIDELLAGETVIVRKHYVGLLPGVFTNFAQIKRSFERPDVLIPLAFEATRVRVLPGPAPDLDIAVKVDRPQVNVGEYGIFIVSILNRAAQPAFNVYVRETDAAETGFAFEAVRSYGPAGDDRTSSGALRVIPRIEAGATYEMSRTMRLRKPGRIPYVAKITGVNGVLEANLPVWQAGTEVTGTAITGDIAAAAVPDRTNVKNGDLVNFVLVHRNLSPHLASHVGLYGGVGAGFQMLNNDLGSYGYYFGGSRPRDLQSGAGALTEWVEIGAQAKAYSFFSAYAVGEGQLTMGAVLSKLDQVDADPGNDLTGVEVTARPASARISLRQMTMGPSVNVGEFVPFVTEIRNEGPDRVTGLTLLETASANLELSYSSLLTGVSGHVETSFLDSLVRLPSLEPGQSFIWQRTFASRAVGNAWRRVRVAGFDQTALAPLAESEAVVNVQPVQADLQLQFLDLPTVAELSIPRRVTVRVRNLGPMVATRAKIAVTSDGLTLSRFGYGPRATLDLLSTDTFQTGLRPGESAILGFDVTPTREGEVRGMVGVVQSDQIDPNPANDSLSFTFHPTPAPPIQPILHVRKVRMDFFDRTPIAELEVDQAMLNRLAPFTTFALEGSSNLQDWEVLTYVGWIPSAPVTFIDHAAEGVKGRAYRLRR